MEKDTEKTIVVFRKFKDDGDIIALFPHVKWSDESISSYMHVGQHGGADYIGCLKQSVPATKEEYKALQKELESLGYDLIIKKKKMNNYRKEN